MFSVPRIVPEGDLHRELVRALSAYIAKVNPGALVTFIDGGRFDRTGSPPLLAGFRPDIYALEYGTRRVVIGEAKTPGDVDNDHTRSQLGVYFQHVCGEPCGEVWVAVPITSAGAAYRVCRAARRRLGLCHVRFFVTGWLLGPRPVAETWHG